MGALSANCVHRLVISKIKMASDKQRGKPHKTFNGGTCFTQVKVWAANSRLLCCTTLCYPACDLLLGHKASLWKLVEYKFYIAFII